MTELQAEAKGYEFTGHFSYNTDELKLKAEELRALGNKAIVIRAPSIGGGYSIYWIEGDANRIKREAKEREQRIASLRRQRVDLEQKIAEIDAQLIQLI